ncbi:MAG: ribbon-helix-helix protein, CopG family [Oscillospiraceae bacterium]|nr:ribbon-helix-helix protein, CopG family [Oscillospiraceae bacterium]MDE5884538.1 ribbon-helix-helix protein, CopG family [Oscillospiraceae bacterium]
MATSKKAVAKYKAKAYDRIEILVPKGDKEKIKAHAEKQGESLNAFIKRAIRQCMEDDSYKL